MTGRHAIIVTFQTDRDLTDDEALAIESAVSAQVSEPADHDSCALDVAVTDVRVTTATFRT